MLSLIISKKAGMSKKTLDKQLAVVPPQPSQARLPQQHLLESRLLPALLTLTTHPKPLQPLSLTSVAQLLIPI